MAENRVRLTNGQLWTARQFLDHYRSARISGASIPVGDAPAPVAVDMSWYMGEGPGRFYHPGMFPIIDQIVKNRNLATGTYDITKLARDDKARSASVSNYITAPWSSDFPLRALVFGNESAKISGRVVVNNDGSKRFEQIEIRPNKTGFDFWPKTDNRILETARAIARKYYDPESQGIGYDIPIYGTGRVYDPFTDSELNAALQYPGSGPPGLLPSVTQHPPLPYINEHLRYLDQASGNSPRASASGAGALPVRVVSPANRNSSGNDIANWIAGLAGVDPQNQTQPAPSQDGRPLGFFTNKPMPQWPVPPPIFDPR